MFLLNMLAIVYYFKLYKHVQHKVVTKYVVTGKQAEAEEYKTGRHFSPELCFLSLIYGQFVFQLVYIAILNFNSDNNTSGLLGLILGKLRYSWKLYSTLRVKRDNEIFVQ